MYCSIIELPIVVFKLQSKGHQKVNHVIKITWFTFWYQNCFLCYTVYLFIFFAAVASC